MVGISAVSSALSAAKTVTFDKLDTNKDGTVSMEELAAATSSSSTTDTASTKKTEKLFKAMDADGDGAITSTEKDTFDAALKDRMQATGFMAQQMGGPGGPGGPPPPPPEDLFEAADSDGDGGVSLTEFTEGNDASSISTEDAKALFELIDTDSDGSISKDETKSFFDAMKPEGMDKAERRGPPPPPPGGKPGEKPEDGQGSTTSVSLLSAAQKAYESSSSLQTDITTLIASLTDEAA